MVDQTTYYTQLEQGARFLASRAKTEAERIEHLRWANLYYRRRLDAQPFLIQR